MRSGSRIGGELYEHPGNGAREAVARWCRRTIREWTSKPIKFRKQGPGSSCLLRPRPDGRPEPKTVRHDTDPREHARA